MCMISSLATIHGLEKNIAEITIPAWMNVSLTPQRPTATFRRWTLQSTRNELVTIKAILSAGQSCPLLPIGKLLAKSTDILKFNCLNTIFAILTGWELFFYSMSTLRCEHHLESLMWATMPFFKKINKKQKKKNSTSKIPLMQWRDFNP